MDIQLLLVPYDSGQRGWRCGAGPEHLVRAGLPAHLQRQGHIVTAIHTIEDDPAYPPAEIRTAFELARRLATTVRSARTVGHFPLVLSWHHLGATVPGFQPVAAEATFLLGARDLDPPEAALLQGSAITAIPVGQIPEGLPGLLARAPLADTLGYLHLDVDVLDPAIGHANYLPAPNGLSLPHLTAAIAVVRARVPLGAAALTSYSPVDDHDQGVCRAAFAAIDAIVANGA